MRIASVVVMSTRIEAGFRHPVLPACNLHTLSQLVWVQAMKSQILFFVNLKCRELSDGAKLRPSKQVCNCTLTFGGLRSHLRADLRS